MHFHLLPGVDDGPATLDQSLRLAEAAVADGTGTVVCTPHVELVEVGTLPDRVHELDASLRAAGIELSILAGGEVRVGAPMTAAELEIVAQGPPGRRWLLLEAPLQEALFGDFHAYADELEAQGYGLLIAHPERCAPLLEPGGGLEHRLSRGARLQVNASSLTGAHGPRERAAGFALLASGRVSAIASDAHGADRPPLLSAATTLLEQRGMDAAPMLRLSPAGQLPAINLVPAAG
ncbi:MAG: CpsB/CapC family capsule biosynthesis tyrosine phosphatase [Solirubrobacteraceae bacterium]